MRPVFGKTQFATLLLTALFLALSATAAFAAPAVRGPADQDQLPAELKGQDIKTFYAPTGANRAGVIQTVIGRVIVMIGSPGVQQNGTAAFDTTGNYKVTGTGYVQGATGTGSANGNFYGPAANWTGGVWNASAGGQNANGNVVASKP